VAYFSPDDKVLAALKAVSKLRLLVANDFQANNRDPVEQLSETHWSGPSCPSCTAETCTRRSI